MSVPRLGLLAAVLLLVTTCGPPGVKGGDDKGVFLNVAELVYNVQYKFTGNFEIVNPFPDGIIIWWFQDIWFSRPEYEYDWNVTQTKYFAGYGNLPVVQMAQRELWDAVNDFEVIIRDVVELGISAARVVFCIVTSFVWDIGYLLRPMGGMRARHEIHFSKRSRLDDTFLNSTPDEWAIIRCVKRGIEQVLMVLAYILKFFYYIGKLVVRAFWILTKIIVSLVHVPLPWLSFSIDGTICFMVGALFSEKLGLAGKHLCNDIFKELFEIWFDIWDWWDQETFIESMDWARALIQIDDRIQNVELQWFSNLTYWRVADSGDKVRFDGTAHMDRYYRDGSSMIQSNEDSEEHNTDWSRQVLLSAKEEWCTAAFMPPTDDVYRTEFKIKYLSRIIKNDHRLDVAEARCLLVFLSRNLAYNTDPMKNSVGEIGRMLERMHDVVGALPRLRLVQMKLAHQNYFLQGVHHFLRECITTTRRQLPKQRFEENMENIGKRLHLALTKMTEKVCPGTKEWRQRVNSELQIFTKMRVTSMDTCKDHRRPLRLGGPSGGPVRRVHLSQVPKPDF